MGKMEKVTLEHILNKNPWTVDDMKKKTIVRDNISGISYLKRTVRRREAINKIRKFYLDVIVQIQNSLKLVTAQ